MATPISTPSDSERLERIKNGLHCTDEQAKEILEYDKRVDKNESTEYDLTREQQKIAASYTRTGTRQVLQTKPRNKKDNPTKASIIADLSNFLSEKSSTAIENLQVVNPERLISFQVGADKFELTLTQKRK